MFHISFAIMVVCLHEFVIVIAIRIYTYGEN